MSFAIHEPGDSAWLDVLTRVPHDVYHLPGYARVCGTHERWPVRLAIASSGDDVLVMPFMRRDLPRGVPGCDITVPYGYPGPVCSSADEAVQEALMGELFAGFADMGAITAFIRCHPFLGIGLGAYGPAARVVVHGDQVYLDLTAAPDDIASSFRPGHRQNIVALRHAGFSLRIDDARDIAYFPELYRRNMVRLGADPYYHFPDAYFREIGASLVANAHYVTAVSPEGRAAAMALVLVCGEMGQYHLSCTEDEYLKSAPSKLSILGMAQLCRDLGVERLNLGGGVGGENDSLLSFKAGFSSCRAAFATVRAVLDAGRYEELSREVDAPAGFFPAYRSGL